MAQSLDRCDDNGRGNDLLPAGPIGHKAHAVVHHALVAEYRDGLAPGVRHRREQLVLVHLRERLLAVTLLTRAIRAHGAQARFRHIDRGRFAARART